MTQIENVPRPTPGLPQDALGLSSDLVDRREQDDGIKIALNGDIVAEASPTLVELDSPIKADDGTASLALQLQ